jgi:hypothetical protein
LWIAVSSCSSEQHPPLGPDGPGSSAAAPALAPAFAARFDDAPEVPEAAEAEAVPGGSEGSSGAVAAAMYCRTAASTSASLRAR